MVKNKGERVRPLIVKSFDVLDREIREYSRKRQQMVKHHEKQGIQGKIIEILGDKDHGFIKEQYGSEIYFHRHAVKDAKLEELRPGDRVRLSVEQGEKGPQAIWVGRA